jgi:DHA2 family multidrug resistance protein
MASAAPSDAPPLSPDAPWRPRANPWLIAAAVMAATFMEVLDTTVVNVSLPHIAGTLSSTIDESTWVLTSYLVANAIVLPMTGWLGRTFGRKRFLIGCIIVFTIASAWCGAATSLPMLIIARIVQGAGGGALQPISQAVLLESFPPEKRGVAMAVFIMGIVVAPIIGPTLGGWMTDNYSWRWVFYVNLPVGVIAILMTQVFIEDPPYLKNARPGQIDYIGFGLLAIFVATLQIVLDKGQQEDWLGSHFIRTLLIISIITGVFFVLWELAQDEPLVNLHVFKDRNFATGTSLMTVMGIVLYGSIAILPLFLQTLMGYSAYESGLTLSPRGFGSIAGTILVGRLIGFLDGRMFVFLGLCVLAYSTALFGDLTLQVASSNVMWPNIINGFGTAIVFVPMTTMAVGTLSQEQMGNATGIFNLMRNLGGGIGISMMTTLIARRAQQHQAILVGHLTPYDPAYKHWMETVGSALQSHGGTAAEITHRAHGILYGQLVQQANLLAYVDAFRVLVVLCVLCLPGVFLFRRAKRKGPVMAH